MKGKSQLLTASEIGAVRALYKVYRKKKRVERRVIEEVFYRATGKKLGRKYWGIPIVRKLVELER